MQKLIEEIKAKLKGQNNLIAISLKNAIESNQDGKEMFGNIIDMAKDNYVIMRAILGRELLIDIINYRYEQK